jgi:parvulin-like peptidyl-prolyl isomerase
VLVLIALTAGAMLAAGGSASAVPEDVYRAYAQRNYTGAEQILKTALAGATDSNAILALSIELGDVYLDKLRDYPAAESIYSKLIDEYPNAPNIADVVYRLGVTYEREEKYLDAAQAYEKVAIKYQGSTYADDGLNAIERCFRKNYQDRAAVVDSYPITRLEFDDMVSRSPSEYEKFDQKLKLLNSMIDDRLLYAEAVRLKLDHDTSFTNQMSDFRRDQMMQTWYDREVTKQVTIPDSAKQNYYQAHHNDYVTPAQVRAREIQVKTMPEAESLRALLVAGKAPFETLAKANSLAPDKGHGGDMGFFRRGTRAKAIDDAAFSLKPGELSSVLKTGDSAYVLLRVEEKREQQERSYSDVADEIETRLKPQKTQERLDSLLTALKQRYAVIDSTALTGKKDTLGTVDGVPIRTADLNKLMEQIPPMYRSQFETPEGKKRLLDQVVTEQVVLRQAEQEKLWLVNDVVGQTLDHERDLMLQMVKKQQITDKVKIDDKEVQAEYNRTRKDYWVPEQVHAHEIVSRNEDEALNIHDELVDPDNPVSFDSMARTASIGQTRYSGGDMGTIKRGQKPKPIDRALFSLKPKAISNVIDVNDTTYEILRVDDHKPAYTKSLKEVRPTIEQELRQKDEKSASDAYLAELRKQAKIEILITEENTAPPPAESLPPTVSDTGAAGQPAPVEVQPQAAVQPEKLGTVYFGATEATLKADARKTLDSIVATLKAETALKVTVTGWADSTGKTQQDAALALKRAQAVVAYLEKAGIDATRLATQSEVETGVMNNTQAAKAKARRVDIIVK